MNRLDISFELSPWERYLQTKQAGDSVSGTEMLTLLEGESEQQFEDALNDLETACMNLDVSDLPRTMGSGEAASRLRQEVQLAKEGLPVSGLDPQDPLRLYLEEVAATPAFGDETVLAQECAKGDEDAMIRLTNLGLSRVIEIARGHTGYGVLLLDLIQEGSLGLWQAIRNYRYGEYAPLRDRWIRFYMARAVLSQARSNGVGQKMRTALEDYKAVDERLLSQLGRNPTLEEIAQELHMTEEEASSVKKMLDDARILARVKAPEPEETPEEEEQPVENTALFQLRQRVGDLLSGIPEADARLLALRFGLEGGSPLSPEETAVRLGMTTQQVLRREAEVLALLRNGK